MKYWRTALPVLRAYQHVASFKAVEAEAIEILLQLKDKLRARLQSLDAPAAEVCAALALLPAYCTASAMSAGLLSSILHGTLLLTFWRTHAHFVQAQEAASLLIQLGEAPRPLRQEFIKLFSARWLVKPTGHERVS